MNIAKVIKSQTGPLAQAGMVSLWGASSLIESIQRGTIAVTSVASNTATITGVDTTRSVVLHHGVLTTDGGAEPRRPLLMLVLTNGTTVTATKGESVASTTVAYTVVQFVPGLIKLIQRGTIALASVTSNTATITGVNPDKTTLITGSNNSDTTVNNSSQAHTVLTNATTITTSRSDGTGTVNAAYQAVELF